MKICDSGPLIHLSRVGELGLLKQLFGAVMIPPSVYLEAVVEAKRLRKPGVAAIEAAVEAGWVRVAKLRARERRSIERLTEEESIEAADAEVIYLARRERADLITNDRWLATVAKSLGIGTLWATTLVLFARKRRILSKRRAVDVMGRLTRSGLYLRPDVYQEALALLERL